MKTGLIACLKILIQVSASDRLSFLKSIHGSPNCACCCRDFEVHDQRTHLELKALDSLAKCYDQQLNKEEEIQLDERDVAKAGHLDAKKHLEDVSQEMLSTNIIQAMTTMLDTIVF